MELIKPMSVSLALLTMLSNESLRGNCPKTININILGSWINLKEQKKQFENNKTGTQ